MTEIKTRNPYIDLIKGYGIILMVAGHSNSPGSHFFYLFHMAIFFIASGFCYNSKNSKCLKNCFIYLKRKITSLYIPFVIWTVFFVLIHNFLLKLNFYTTNDEILQFGKLNIVSSYWSGKIILVNCFKSLFMIGGNVQFNGAFWFLQTLLLVSVLFNFIDYLLNKIVRNFCNEMIYIIVHFAISIIFLFCGYYFSKNNILIVNINRVFSCYILFWLGTFCRKKNILFYEGIIGHVIVFFISFFTLLLLNNMGSIGLSTNNYKNPLFFLLASVFGFFFLYELSFFSNKNKYLLYFVSLCGKYSIYIMIFHFISFKIISFFIVLINDYPKFYLAIFPCLSMKSYYWLFYLFVGTIIPLILGIIISKIKIKIKTFLF